MRDMRLRLGLGLVSIGRVWGIARTEPPSDAQARDFFQRAWELGIRIFDTAPAYASSESRFGQFIATLEPTDRGRIVVMTKAGEHWDDERDASFVDHTRDALCRSIDRSLTRLGQIDVLQLHKASTDVVRHPDVVYALDYARSCGIHTIGASVSDVESGLAALDSGLYQALQFPFNVANTQLMPLVSACQERGVTAIINRPFAMGALVSNRPFNEAAWEAFRFLREEVESGIILTGTNKPAHLAQNIEAFQRAESERA